MSDKSIGYIVLIFLFLFIGGTITLILFTTTFIPEKRVVVFQQIGNLRQEDPVVLQGVTVGKVKKIEWNNNRAIVTIESEKAFPIYKGYSITSVDKGIMGDRILALACLDSSNIPMNKNDTLIGSFKPGVAEAIGKAWKLKSFIESYSSLFHDLLTGTPKKKSLIEQYTTYLQLTDSISRSLTEFSTSFSKEITETTDSISKILAELNTTTHTTLQGVKHTSLRIDSALVYVSSLCTDLDSTLGQFKPYTDKLKDSTSITVWNNRIDDLRKNLVAVESAATTLKKTALRLNVHFSFH